MNRGEFLHAVKPIDKDIMSALPIPEFYCVVDTIRSQDGTVCLVTLDPNCGRKVRYNTIRINLKNGKTVCTGRKLPLRMARKVAIRPAKEDGNPLT